MKTVGWLISGLAIFGMGMALGRGQGYRRGYGKGQSVEVKDAKRDSYKLGFNDGKEEMKEMYQSVFPQPRYYPYNNSGVGEAFVGASLANSFRP